MSFSHELLNDSCKEEGTKSMESNKQVMTRNKVEPIAPASSVFSSLDFGKFLSTEFKNNAVPLSKDSQVFNSIESSAFKSKDAFSNLFKSSDWQMKFETATAPQEPPQDDHKKALAKVFSSKEWMPMKTLGSHVEVDYTHDMFSGAESETSDSELPAELPPTRTDWDGVFFTKLQLHAPAPSLEQLADEVLPQPVVASSESALPSLESEPAGPAVAALPNVAPIATPESETNLTVETKPAKRKRKRKPRKKVVPEVKQYVEPTDDDVLLGRGGRSNHHPGNKRYREEVKNLHQWYLGISDKDEKTDLSQCLVDYVHSYKGRFLEKDSHGWYIVPNIVARRKASQALREDPDPEKRAQKRARYLERKAKQESKQVG